MLLFVRRSFKKILSSTSVGICFIQSIDYFVVSDILVHVIVYVFAIDITCT